MSDMPDWQPAIAVNQLTNEGFHKAIAGTHPLIVLRADDQLVAYRDACPHEGHALSTHGERLDFIIVCNKHLWEFDAATGEHISRVPRPQCNLKRYPTREVDGMVEVDVSADA
jgi:nitrite reductase/ring-hydroxylating ferredoxin subunit